MWSCAKTLESIIGVRKGENENELIVILGPHADPDMIVKTICSKINEVFPFPLCSAFKKAIAANGDVSRDQRDQAIAEAIEKQELRIQIPPFISPHNIFFFHVGKGYLKTPIFKIQQ